MNLVTRKIMSFKDSDKVRYKLDFAATEASNKYMKRLEVSNEETVEIYCS